MATLAFLSDVLSLGLSGRERLGIVTRMLRILPDDVIGGTGGATTVRLAGKRKRFSC